MISKGIYPTGEAYIVMENELFKKFQPETSRLRATDLMLVPRRQITNLRGWRRGVPKEKQPGIPGMI